MRVEDVVFEVDDAGTFEIMPECDCYIRLDRAEPAMRYECLIKSGLDPSREVMALTVCAQLLTHIEDHELDRAIEMDDWQLRSDGNWQKWLRPVTLPSLE
jgi:hypothetical protein